MNNQEHQNRIYWAKYNVGNTSTKESPEFKSSDELMKFLESERASVYTCYSLPAGVNRNEYKAS